MTVEVECDLFYSNQANNNIYSLTFFVNYTSLLQPFFFLYKEAPSTLPLAPLCCLRVSKASLMSSSAPLLRFQVYRDFFKVSFSVISSSLSLQRLLQLLLIKELNKHENLMAMLPKWAGVLTFHLIIPNHFLIRSVNGIRTIHAILRD